MAVKVGGKEKRDEYVRSLKQPPAVLPPRPPASSQSETKASRK